MRSNQQTGHSYSLDEKDLALISRLQLDGRCSLAKMAQDLDIHRTTVKARLDRLLRDRIIAPLAHVDPVLLGYEALATIGMRVAPGHMRVILNEMATLKNVSWVHTCQGTYDVVLSGARFRDEDDLYSFVTDKIGRIPGIIAVDIMRSQDLEAFALPAADQAQPNSSRVSSHISIRRGRTEVRLDENERAIISELQNDSRQSVSALASTLGMNRNAVAASMRSMFNRGVIRTVMIADPVALGYRIGVVCGISVLPGQLNTVVEKLSRLQNLQYLITCVGRYNILTWSQYRDLDSWHQTIMTELANIHGIKETSSSVILREMKNPYQFSRLS